MAEDKITVAFGECQVAVDSLPAAAVLTRTANSMVFWKGVGATIKYRGADEKNGPFWESRARAQG